MVKFTAGFVSNSSSSSYFVLWTDKTPHEVLEETDDCHCGSAASLVDEMEGFPPDCHLAATTCGIHTAAFWEDDDEIEADPPPQRPSGEKYVCHECTKRSEDWLSGVAPWARRRRAAAKSSGDRSARSTTHGTRVRYDDIIAALNPTPPATQSQVCLGQQTLVWIFKHVLTIREPESDDSESDEIATHHGLPKNEDDILNATKTLLSLSTVCKSWREAALDDDLWREVVKNSCAKDFLPGKYDMTIPGLDLVSTCKELAIRVSKQVVAQNTLHVRFLAPNFYTLLRHLSKEGIDEALDFIRGNKTGTIICEEECDIGATNDTLEYWRDKAKLLAYL
ncbi:hypothetical protein Pelo_5881 [Pelomyxa schiedti]|nr:hypothetical protein Pelo_5881 [Pelomyxa schiedti]